MIKHLIIKLNYKVIVLEAGFSNVQILNNYILYGNDDKNLGSMGIGFLQNPKFLNFVKWLKEYNDKQSISNKVKIFGCDMANRVTGMHISTGKVKLKKELSSDALAGLKLILGPINYKVNSSDKKVLQQLTLELKQEILRYPDTSVLRHSIYNTLGYLEYFQEKYEYNRSKLRDKYMAENVVWIYKHELKNNILILAHNIHISKYPIYTDIKRMGITLKRNIKRNTIRLDLVFSQVVLLLLMKKHINLLCLICQKLKILSLLNTYLVNVMFQILY